MYRATAKPSGMVNNIRVRCSRCSAQLFVNPNHAKSSGGWQCPHCNQRH